MEKVKDVTLEPIEFKELKTINNQLYVGAYDEGRTELGIIPIKVIKGWESFSGWYWFATEKYLQPSDRTSFELPFGSGYPQVYLYSGLVQGHEEEFGSWSMHELTPLIVRNKVWEIKSIDLPSAGRRHAH